VCHTGEKEKTTPIVRKPPVHQGGNDLGLSRHLTYLFNHNLSIQPDQDTIIQSEVYVTTMDCQSPL
jgi:hypothetical protein